MASLPKSGLRIPAPTLARVQEMAAVRLGMEQRPGKELLLTVRIGRHMREMGLSDPHEYMRVLEADSTGVRVGELMDLLTTNHTAFWREPGHFEWLREQLPSAWAGEGQRTIWCAAASSGEEPYTLAMVARETLGPAALEKVRILATDVSTRMLNLARNALYTRERIRPLPEAWQRLYFEESIGVRSHCRVKAEIRRMVHFRWLNLVEAFPPIGPFPYIFCRNVMIYFSPETRMKIVRKLLQRLTPDGYLLVGSAEGLSGLETEIDYVRPAVYRRRQAGGASAKQGDDRWL